MARPLSQEYTGTPISIRLTEEDDKIVRKEMKRRKLTAGRAEFVRQLLRESQEQIITIPSLRKELQTFFGGKDVKPTKKKRTRKV